MESRKLQRRILKELLVWAVAIGGAYLTFSSFEPLFDRAKQAASRAGFAHLFEFETSSPRLVREIGGPHVDVVAMVKPGESHETYQPTDAQISRVMSGAAYFCIGMPFENGRAFAARVKLERVSLGELTLEKVEALVTRPGALQQSLLGMSFLSRLRSYEFSGNKLLMKS